MNPPKRHDFVRDVGVVGQHDDSSAAAMRHEGTPSRRTRGGPPLCRVSPATSRHARGARCTGGTQRILALCLATPSTLESSHPSKDVVFQDTTVNLACITSARSRGARLGGAAAEGRKEREEDVHKSSSPFKSAASNSTVSPSLLQKAVKTLRCVSRLSLTR